MKSAIICVCVCMCVTRAGEGVREEERRELGMGREEELEGEKKGGRKRGERVCMNLGIKRQKPFG